MMKNLLLMYFYFLLLGLSSCSPGGKPDEKPEQTDLPNLRTETGGEPDETTAQGTGIFFASDQGCRSGFGLCDIDLAQPNPATEGQGPENNTQRRQKADFYLGTAKDSTLLRIEFGEEIPQFAPSFSVTEVDTLYNAFGYEYVVLTRGNYPTEKGKSHFGQVNIPVTLGPKKAGSPQ